MNVRNSKTIRLGGWFALLATVLAVGAGGFLVWTFFQADDLLNAGIAAAVTAVIAIGGGLLTYGFFLFASMTSAAAASEAVSETPSDATVTPAEAAITAEPDVAESVADVFAETTASPEYSDDALPVYTSPVGEDEILADLLVVPPPPVIDSRGETLAGDSPETTEGSDDFDSRMDLPVTFDLAEDSDDMPPESSDDIVEPAATPQSSTVAITSALTPTDEFDVNGDESITSAAHWPPAEVVAEIAPPSKPQIPSAAQAFPDIFKTAPPGPSAAPPPPAAVAKPASTLGPAPRSEPQKKTVKAVPQPAESLPTAMELPAMASTLTPTAPVGGMLPSEIPDFFLRMPTGRSAPVILSAAPVAPRAIVASKPAAVPPSAVRIIDSSTPPANDDDLVTMTSIPDDWPS